MNDLHQLASAASQVSPYRRRARTRVQARRSSAPLVVAIVVGSIIIGGAIIYLATRHPSGPHQQSADSVPQNVADAQAKEVATQQTRAQAAQFKEFASRLAEALGSARKTSLQAENPSTADLAVKYTCSYMLGHLDTRKAASGRPTEFLAEFSGTADGTGEGYQSKDTTKLSTAFVLDPSGKWKIASATEQPISHSTSTDFMGVPEKGGPQRNIANIDWFNAAVSAAQKHVAPQ